jgi:hypothetical protein
MKLKDFFNPMPGLKEIYKSMTTKISPDEKITMNALDSVDPFTRPGQVRQNLPQPQLPAVNRDLSRFDEPVAEKQKAEAEEIKPKKPKKTKVTKVKVEEEAIDKALAESFAESVAEEVAKVEKQAFVNPIVEARSTEGMPSYRCEFGGRDIFVGFPCYKTTNPVTAFALLAMALDFGRDKIRFDMSIGDAMIYHSRNTLAQKFLDTDAKYMLMIDDDIIPCIGRPQWMRATVQAARNIGDAPLQRHVLHRLVGSGQKLIGGAYFGRQEGAGLMCSAPDLAPRVRIYEDNVAPVEWVATGCMLVHRSVLEDIMLKFPELKPEKPGQPFDFFHPIKSTMGEDVSFCHRAKQAGHQCHIDLGLPVFHVGYKTY